MASTPARKPLISGNWKMHHNHFEAIQTVQKLAFLLSKDDFDAVEVSVHPPFTDIRSVQITLADQKATQIALGAQSCHWEDKGAFTGEISPAFLAKLDVTYVIAGHSERRQLFGETDEMVQKKVHAIYRHAMTPILCCGETLEEREAGTTEQKVVGQVEAGIKGLKNEQLATLVIAYEPIWAIGTGHTATPDDAHGRRDPDPIRRIGQAGQHRGPDGPARHRRRPRRRRQPGCRRVRPHRPVPPALRKRPLGDLLS